MPSSPPSSFAAWRRWATHLSAFDALVYFYFSLHIPATLLIDTQALQSPVGAAHPAFARAALAQYCAVLSDPLMCAAPRAPAWFVSVILAETLLQLPFFFAVLLSWRARPSWLRPALALYGAHTATTLLPIYGAFFGAHAGGSLSTGQLAALSAIYAPFLLVPLALVAYSLRDAYWRPAAVAAATSAAPERARGRSASARRRSGAAGSPAAARTPKIKAH